MSVKLLTEHHLEFLSLKGGCTGSSESTTHVKIPHCWKSHVMAHLYFLSENCKIDYVLFQAATTVRESVIREWTLLSAEDIESLRSFLLRYITQHIRYFTLYIY